MAHTLKVRALTRFAKHSSVFPVTVAQKAVDLVYAQPVDTRSTGALVYIWVSQSSRFVKKIIRS